MTLALTEEHLALAESVRGWAGHAAPAPVIRSAVDAEDHGATLYRDTLRPGPATHRLGQCQMLFGQGQRHRTPHSRNRASASL